jgi:hypothetical protein
MAAEANVRNGSKAAIVLMAGMGGKRTLVIRGWGLARNLTTVKHLVAELSAVGSGPVCAYSRSFEVEDASGARFGLHEFECWQFLSKVSRFELDTGEIVERVDYNTFRIAASGECLTACSS